MTNNDINYNSSHSSTATDSETTYNVSESNNTTPTNNLNLSYSNVNTNYIINNGTKDPSIPTDKELNLAPLEHQKLVLIGAIQYEYLLNIISNEMNLNYFEDYRCKTIFKALQAFYNEYHKNPTLETMYVEADRNRLSEQFPKNTVREMCKELFDAKQIDEKYAIDITVEVIKNFRVGSTLKKTFEALKSGKNFGKIDLANKLVEAMSVDITESDIYNLADISKLAEVRKEALGDEKSSGKMIRSILKGLNDTLQYGGYQVGTLNLVCAPPACFTGDTRIMTSKDKSYHTIKELYDKQESQGIYGSDNSGNLTTDNYEKIYLSKYTNRLVGITINDKYIIRCTPDHPFLLKSGIYKQAKDILDCELMPIQRIIKNDIEVLINYRGERIPVKNFNNITLFSTNDMSELPVFKVTAINVIKLTDKIPVYGIINAGKNHNYAIALNENEGVIVSNTGKTSFLINEGSSAAMQGFNVLHVFLGDMTNYDGLLRYASCIGAKSQTELARMTLENQTIAVENIAKQQFGALAKISVLSYGSGEKTVSEVLETIKVTEKRLNIHYDMVIIDYADNFRKPGDNMYIESGVIYDKLALFGRTHSSVIMVASQPKISYWSQEIIPMEGAAESSKKQHIVDLMLTMNRHVKGATFGSIFVAKCRRGISGTIMRYNSNWEFCKVTEISQTEYDQLVNNFKGN